MSELINKNDNRTTLRWKLLTGASALALAAYVSSVAAAKAEDAGRPQIWIELGGGVDMTQGFNAPFTAPFMTAVTPTPGPYKGNVFNQDAPRFALDMDGQITFRPENSDWQFSAGIRYGRSHTNRHAHHQSVLPLTYYVSSLGVSFHYPAFGSAFADTKAPIEEKHAILDFSAGKDIGLGIFGHDGTSTLSAGVRFAQFTSNASLHISGRPTVSQVPFGLKRRGFPVFDEYMLSGHAERSFDGVGPSLSWQGSAAVAGNQQDGELTLDWGINGAALFGRQRAKTDHQTSAYHETGYKNRGRGYHVLYPAVPHHSTRSRRVTVPNFGGSVGVSFRYPNFKFSIGYRYDTFLKAMDTGIDARKTSNLTFNGPYASISIGIGD